MGPNNPQGKRNRLLVTVILTAALAGLILITLGRTSGATVTFPDSATAQKIADSTTAPASTYQPMGGKTEAAVSLLKTLAALALVVLCIYTVIFLLKKFMRRRVSGQSGTNLLEVLETAHIDPKKSLSLVRVADKSILIGVTENQISMLTELDPQHTQVLLDLASKRSQGDNFISLLKSASDKFKGSGGKKEE